MKNESNRLIMKKPDRHTRSMILNALVILATVLVLVFLAFGSSDAGRVWSAMLEADGRWLLLGLAVWFANMAVEAVAIQCFFRWQRMRIRFFSTLHITLLGMFYSSVTPAATGGQPMQVVAFRKREIPVGVSSSALATKLFCSQFALLAGGVFLWLTHQEAVLRCVGDARWVVFVGFAVNAVVVLVVLLLTVKPGIVQSLLRFLLKAGVKLRLVRNPEHLASRADAAVADFSASVDMLLHHPLRILFMVLLSLLQYALLCSASYCVYRSLHLVGESPSLLMALQWLLFIGASFTPLPGASGAQEGGFYLFYQSIFPPALQMPALLLWRAITFYAALLIGFGAVVWESLRSIRRSRCSEKNVA